MESESRNSVKRAPFARDEPVALERDAFGHSDYVRALASIVTDDEAPSTVGVFGPWGVGKSTIVEGLPSELPDDTAYVYFDAWKYEADSLRRQFLRECGSQLETGNQLDEFSVKEDLAELDVDTQTAKEGLSLSWRRALRAGIFGLLVGGAVFALLSIGELADFIESDSGKALAAAVAAALVGAMASLLSGIIVVTETVVTRRSLQDPDRFADRFAAFLAAVKPGRLVIVVDNLDRCAPEKAVEMLSTIKTYLEPTVRSAPASRSQQTVDKQVTFVVAVDDAALRRHLIAQEMQRTKTPADQDQARKYVDEYLSKFFSARLPIRPILPDDIRHYIQENLDPLIKAREVTEDDGRSLVGLVSTGLRRNPRQIKQFVNDLESRLRLLQERETAREGGKPGISPAVSGEVVMIAKLALLESEFPSEFERLQRQHRKLDEWHAMADSSSEVWIDEKPEKPDSGQQSHAEAFASFLQASRSIHTQNLRALLHLKQASEEAGLPGFQEFRDAVVNEDQPEVERLLVEASPEEQRGYAERMRQLLRDELDQGYVPAARAVVRMMIAVEGLSSFKDERGEVLEAALNDPGLRDRELVFLDPDALLRAGRDLSTARQKELLSPVVTRFAGEGRSPEERRSAAEALGPFAALLTATDRERIKTALQQDDLRGAFELYVALARADAGLLPSGVARAALEELAKLDEQQRNSLLGRDAAFSVATIAVEQEADPELDQLAIDTVIQSLTGIREDPEAFGGTVARALELMPRLVAAPPDQWDRLEEHIQGEWPNFPREHDRKLLELIQLAMSRASDERRGTTANNLAPILFQDPAHGVSLIAEAKASLIPELKRPVADQLVQIGSQHVAERDQAAAVLCDLVPDEAGNRIAEIVAAAVQQNQEDSAIRLLDEQKAVLAEHRGTIATTLLSWAETQMAGGGRVPYAALARLTPAMTQEQMEQFARMTVRQLGEGNAEATQAIDDLANAGPDRALEEVVAQAVETLEGADTLQGPTAELLQRLAPHVARLPEADRVRLSNNLQLWLDAPDQRATAIGAIRSMRGLRAKAANPLVGKLIEVSDQEVNEPEAVAALSAAHAISGAKNTRAIRRLNAHLKHLEASSEEDQAVARAFREAQES